MLNTFYKAFIQAHINNIIDYYAVSLLTISAIQYNFFLKYRTMVFIQNGIFR